MSIKVGEETEKKNSGEDAAATYDSSCYLEVSLVISATLHSY